MLSKINFRNRFLGVVFLSLLFQGLFWEEDLSINLLIFSVVIGGISFYFEREKWQDKKIFFVVLGAFSALGCIILHHTFLAFLAFFASVCIWLGLIMEPKLKLLFFAFLNGIIKPLFFLINIFEKTISEIPENQEELISQKPEKKSNFYKKMQFWIIPVFICFIFFISFKAGNHVFDHITNQIGLKIFETFSYISLERVPTMLLGAFIVIIIFSKVQNHYFSFDEENQTENMIRTRQKSVNLVGFHLKHEYWTGIFTLVLVNGLIFCVNLVDIFYLWIGFDKKAIKDFAQVVHDGTYILIFTVLLSMGILMYFFRKNLNFLPNNKFLVLLASLWLVQNVFMVFSVALRTWHYIVERGLAYKRIGVLVFLVLTLFGITTLYLKINQKKTFYFLWRTNMIAVYVMLILTSWVNWDNVIAKYNFANFKNFSDFDILFAVTLNNSTLPILKENWYKIPKELKERAFYGDILFEESSSSKSYTMEQHLNQRISDFKRKKAKKSWLSWNYAENEAMRELGIRNEELKNTVVIP